MTIHEAAERLGLHYMTIYRYVRTGRLPAQREGGTWAIDIADLEPWLHAPRQRASGRKGAPSRGKLVRGLASRLIGGDEPGAWSVVEATMSGGADPGDVYMDLFVPALRLVGERWEHGEIGVADEHRATVVVQRLIGRLGPRFRQRGRPRGVIVLGTPEGELHGLPTAMVADLLRGEGFDVVDLGANVPTRAFVDCVREWRPVVAVGIAVTGPGHRTAVRRLVRALRAAEADIRVIVGGAGLTEPEALNCGADFRAQDGRALARSVSGWQRFQTNE